MWIFFFLYLFLNILGLMLLKSGFNEFALPNLPFYEYKTLLQPAIQNPKFICGFMLYAFSFLSWLIILSRYQLTYAYPLVIGLSCAGIIIASVIFCMKKLNYLNLSVFSLLGLAF